MSKVLLAHTFRGVRQSARLSEPAKLRLLDYFALGMPAYRLRFRGPASRAATERFFHLIRQVTSLAEDSNAPFEGAIECDETMRGGPRNIAL